jgi:putative Holliday junction resolvase
MRVLALDHGSRRIGYAWSDPLLVAAHPGGVLERTTPEADLAALARLCQEQEVSLVVVGLPLNMDGSEGPQAASARRFMVLLREHLGLPVEAWDERLTTREARRILQQDRRSRRDRRDALAAALLLSSFLEANRDRIARGASGGVSASPEA